MSQAIKYIYINLIIGYGNETVKFVITMKFLCVQIDDNVSSICLCKYNSACFAMMAVTGQQLLYIIISLCLSELAFGTVGQFFGQQEHPYF